MQNRSALDAIIIADSGIDSLSGTNPLKLHLDGRVGTIQVIAEHVCSDNHGDTITGAGYHSSWSSAPRLNGIYLASYLGRKNFTVELIRNYAVEKDNFISLLRTNPKAVIISTSFIFFKKTLSNLVRDIREEAPDIPIIAGGTFVYSSYLLLKRAKEKNYETSLPADDFLFLKTDREPAIDLYIISPRGEDTLCQVLHNIRKGLPVNTIENTACFDGNSYSFAPRLEGIKAAQPEPIDWQTLPASFFASGVIPLQASNGCPYDCAFCNFNKDRRYNFLKPLECLVEELQTVQDRGVRYVWFVDDNFRQGRQDLDLVSRRFIAAGLQLRWMCFVRASTLQKTNLELLRQAGCVEVQIGLESGDPGILKNMNKMASPEMYEKVIGNVLEQGINVSCYFITGFPGETEATAATTRDFIRRIEYPDAEGSLSWSIYPFLLSPLSPVYEPSMRKKFGLQGYLKEWRHATMDYNGAKKMALRAFLELENSGQIYREDSLDMLHLLPWQKRKRFYTARHLLAKKALQGGLDKEDVRRAFSGIF